MINVDIKNEILRANVSLVMSDDKEENHFIDFDFSTMSKEDMNDFIEECIISNLLEMLDFSVGFNNLFIKNQEGIKMLVNNIIEIIEKKIESEEKRKD